LQKVRVICPFFAYFNKFPKKNYIFTPNMSFNGKTIFDRACGAGSKNFPPLRTMAIMLEFYPLGFE